MATATPKIWRKKDFSGGVQSEQLLNFLNRNEIEPGAVLIVTPQSYRGRAYLSDKTVILYYSHKECE